MLLKNASQHGGRIGCVVKSIMVGFRHPNVDDAKCILFNRLNTMGHQTGGASFSNRSQPCSELVCHVYWDTA